MKLIEATRPARYTGPIRDCPTKKIVAEGNYDQPTTKKETFESVYETWSQQFFEKRPRGRLSHDGFFGDLLVVRGTGDNGLWLVAWWIED